MCYGSRYCNSLLEEVSCENNILKECLEEKEQELDILKNVITQNKALLEEVYYSSSNMLMKKLREKYRLERIGLRNYGGLIVTN